MKNPCAFDHKVQPEHLGRKAIVYLRQSSDKQVRENLESQRLQRAMADRARALGWSNVEVIDSDLGRSASVGAKRREGFESIVAQVSLGEVGIIFSYELSRLSRTDKDWCQLFEILRPRMAERTLPTRPEEENHPGGGRRGHCQSG